MNPRRQMVPSAPADTWDDEWARIVETWDAWIDQPFDFHANEMLRSVVGKHIDGLRAELARAGWRAARPS